MADNFVGEIRLFPFNFAPQGWAQCNGQILPISQNTVIFSLIGTYYGGNGTSNFALPNLQGAVALDMGQGEGLTLRDIGETGGSATVTLTTSEIPAHSHSVNCAATTGNAASPSGNSFGAAQRGKPPGYAPATGTSVNMSGSAVKNEGGGGAHNNLQPYLTLNFCIALVGVYPSRS
jgi:microcystin-dependent protein